MIYSRIRTCKVDIELFISHSHLYFFNQCLVMTTRLREDVDIIDQYIFDFDIEYTLTDTLDTLKSFGRCYLYPWWIIPGPNRLSVLICGDRAQIGPYQPCPLQSFSAVDSHFSA